MVSVIGELSINHLGSRKIAIQMIAALKEVGADYVKLKRKDVNRYYKSSNKTFREFPFKDYRASLELSDEDFFAIDQYCKDVGMSWFCTIHDTDTYHFIVENFDVPFLKIASSDAQNEHFVSEIAELNKNSIPMIVSTGGLTYDQSVRVANIVADRGIPVVLNHVVAIYPCPVSKCNLGMINALQSEFAKCDNVKIGYSGHEVGWIPSLTAVQMGIDYLERHFTLSKDLKIHHIDSALSPDEFGSMMRAISDFNEVKDSESFEIGLGEYDFLELREYK